MRAISARRPRSPQARADAAEEQARLQQRRLREAAARQVEAVAVEAAVAVAEAHEAELRVMCKELQAEEGQAGVVAAVLRGEVAALERRLANARAQAVRGARLLGEQASISNDLK